MCLYAHPFSKGYVGCKAETLPDLRRLGGTVGSANKLNIFLSMRKRLPRYYFGTNWTNTRKAAKKTTSRKCLVFLYNKTIANRTVRSCSIHWPYACATRFNFLNWNCKTKNIHDSRHMHSMRLFFENAVSLLSYMHE